MDIGLHNFQNFKTKWVYFHLTTICKCEISGKALFDCQTACMCSRSFQTWWLRDVTIVPLNEWLLTVPKWPIGRGWKVCWGDDLYNLPKLSNWLFLAIIFDLIIIFGKEIGNYLAVIFADIGSKWECPLAVLTFTGATGGSCISSYLQFIARKAVHTCSLQPPTHFVLLYITILCMYIIYLVESPETIFKSIL